MAAGVGRAAWALCFGVEVSGGVMTHGSITPIETMWRGYRFRSRTEARWAVALTAARIPFEYEREGYNLPSGRYLPDFWLAERKHWLEIKGDDPSPREIRLALELAEVTASFLLFGIGAPSPDKIELLMADAGGADQTMLLELPAAAYRVARKERFDSGSKNSRPISRPRLDSSRFW